MDKSQWLRSESNRQTLVFQASAVPIQLRNHGAIDGPRTRYPRLGRPVLYQMSFNRMCHCPVSAPTAPMTNRQRGRCDLPSSACPESNRVERFCRALPNRSDTGAWWQPRVEPAAAREADRRHLRGVAVTADRRAKSSGLDAHVTPLAPGRAPRLRVTTHRALRRTRTDCLLFTRQVLFQMS